MSDSDPTKDSSHESLWMRLLWMVVIAILMGMAQTLLNVLALVQLIVLAVTKRQANAEIAGFGRRLGLWMAKSARFQTAESDEKPWPWSGLD